MCQVGCLVGCAHIRLGVHMDLMVLNNEEQWYAWCCSVVNTTPGELPGVLPGLPRHSGSSCGYCTACFVQQQPLLLLSLSRFHLLSLWCPLACTAPCSTLQARQGTVTLVQGCSKGRAGGQRHCHTPLHHQHQQHIWHTRQLWTGALCCWWSLLCSLQLM